MRKLLELVMIIVFCVSMASGSTIMLISDSGFWSGGAAVIPDATGGTDAADCQDTLMVSFLNSLGYTVDTSGMGGEYRDGENWVSDPAKVAALNAADLIIVSRKTSSTYYRNYRKDWNELTVPILCQCGSMIRGSGKWGWCVGSIAQQELVTNMNVVMGHPLVDGFSDPVTVFVEEDIPAKAQNPKPDTVWDSHTSIIGTYDGSRMLVDIPAGTNFLALSDQTTYDYGVSGARRVYLGIYTYDADTWSAGLTDDYKNLFAQVVDMTMNSTVKIVNDLPAHDATEIPVYLENSENDLVFTILDPNVVEVDVYLGMEGDPNLVEKSGYIIKHIPVTAGLNSVDLESGVPANLLEDGHLKWYKDYHWKVIGYEPNLPSDDLVPVTAGPTWKFKTEPEAPIISGVSPLIATALVGDPNAVFTVEGINIESYQWCKEGVGELSGDHYSGVDTDTLVIKNIVEGDVGFYYCVGTRDGFPDVTSTPSGELQLKELKHYFPFESDTGGITLDVIGDIQAQLMGGASLEPNGINSIIGGYLQLDNSEASEYDEEYVKILNDVTNYPEITITAWFRQYTRDIGCIWDVGEDQSSFFTFTSGYSEDAAKVQFEYEVEGVQKQGEYEVDYNRTDGWQFVAVTLDSVGNSKMYIDGEFKGSKDLRGDDVSEVNLTYITKSKNYIGHRIYSDYMSGTPLPKYDGLIDELKIYNYVLSDVQIAQEYINIKGGYVCTEDYDLQAYDYDNNCRLELSDLAEFVTKWLEHDRIYRP